MALLPCRECGQQVSSEAAACPHCGVPFPTRTAPAPRAPASARPRGKTHPAVWAFGGVLALVIAGTCSFAVIGARRIAAAIAAEAAEPKLVDFAEIDVDSARAESEVSDSMAEIDGGRER